MLFRQESYSISLNVMARSFLLMFDFTQKSDRIMSFMSESNQL